MSSITFEFNVEHDYDELAELIREDDLYEASYGGSRFLELEEELRYGEVMPMSGYLANYVDISKLSTIVAYDNDNPIGLMIFENYQFNKSKLPSSNFKFQHDYKTYNYEVLGFSGFYVKEAYRNQGIASKMAQMLENKLLSKMILEDNTVYLVAGASQGAKILRDNLEILATTNNHENSNVWKRDAKSFVRYNSLRIARLNYQAENNIEEEQYVA